MEMGGSSGPDDNAEFRFWILSCMMTSQYSQNNTQLMLKYNSIIFTRLKVYFRDANILTSNNCNSYRSYSSFSTNKSNIEFQREKNIMEDLDLALSGLEKVHKVVNDVSPFLSILTVASKGFHLTVICRRNRNQ